MRTKLCLFFLKIRQSIGKPAISKLMFIILGVTSTAWFLIRVIPKPQRATYPCMKAAAPLMSTFVIYLLSFSGSMVAFGKAKGHFKKARYLYAAIFFVITTLGVIMLLNAGAENSYAGTKDTISETSNAPIGVGHGIFPGRVVWVFDPEVAKWDGSDKYWWEETSTSQVETDKMFAGMITSLTGKKSEKSAWDALFRNFNETKNRSKNGYTPNEKIAVKINQNNTRSHADTTGLNASPQLVYALIRSLTTEAGVPQKNITIFDASRFIPDNIFNKCHKDFPEVLFVDNEGGNGRIKSTYVERAIPYSVDNGKLATGLASCAVEADYLMNMPYCDPARGMSRKSSQVAPS